MTKRPTTPPGVREFLIGVDPGSAEPRHVLLTPVIHITNRPFRGPLDRCTVIVESQWVNHGVSRQSLMTLSFYCGLHLGSYLDGGAEVWVVPVREWRRANMPGVPSAGQMSKPMYQNLLRAETPVLIRKDGPDAVDAYWIGEAGRRLLTTRTPAELRKLKVKRINWWKKR